MIFSILVFKWRKYFYIIFQERSVDGVGIVIVATVHQKNKHVGYRVFDTEKLEVGDVTTDSIKKYLHNNNKLLNANISKDNKIIGVNCNMMDLPRINLDYAKGSPN